MDRVKYYYGERRCYSDTYNWARADVDVNLKKVSLFTKEQDRGPHTRTHTKLIQKVSWLSSLCAYRYSPFYLSLRIYYSQGVVQLFYY